MHNVSCKENWNRRDRVPQVSWYGFLWWGLGSNEGGKREGVPSVLNQLTVEHYWVPQWGPQLWLCIGRVQKYATLYTYLQLKVYFTLHNYRGLNENNRFPNFVSLKLRGSKKCRPNISPCLGGHCGKSRFYLRLKRVCTTSNFMRSWILQTNNNFIIKQIGFRSHLYAVVKQEGSYS